MSSDDPTPVVAAGDTIWQAGGVLPYPPLDGDATCEVCVIGGGVSGLAVASELASEGRHVIVLDTLPIGSGQTARSTAHLVTALDERYFCLERDHGPDRTRAVARAHVDAIDWIERVAGEASTPCGFSRVEGSLVVPRARAAEALALLERELAAAERAGISCNLTLSTSPLPGGFPAGTLVFPRQAQIHPVQFLGVLADRVLRHGGRIHSGTTVSGINIDKHGHVLATSTGHTVRAAAVIVASHTLPRSIATRVRPLRPLVSYVCGFMVPEGTAPASPSLLWDGYWDDPTPYHYVRVVTGTELGVPAKELLLVGGEDTPGDAASDAEPAYASIEAWTREHFPLAGPRVANWWGRIYEPESEFALIGAVPGLEGVYVVAGDSGNGMTYAAIAAMRLSRAIAGEATASDNPFDPAPSRSHRRPAQFPHGPGERSAPSPTQ